MVTPDTPETAVALILKTALPRFRYSDHPEKEPILLLAHAYRHKLEKH